MSDTKPLISMEALEAAVHQALRAWYKSQDASVQPLQGLLLVQEKQTAMQDQSVTLQHLATNQVLYDCLTELRKQESEAAEILQSRFLDDETILMVANKLGLSEDQIKREQRKAIHALTRVLRLKELEMRAQRVQSIEAKLEPSSYKRLYGVEATLETLVTQLLLPDAPLLLALAGIGGIGKTSVADAAVRQVIHKFYYQEVIWLRVAEQSLNGTLPPDMTFNDLMAQLAQRLLPTMSPTTLPEVQLQRVRHILKSIPYLIVIDNLEQETHIAYMLPYLYDLAGPSKFLLTTRTRLSGQTAVFHLPLRELPIADAADLIRDHAHDIGLDDVAQATDAQVETVYRVVGGNPLALKLVVSLAAVLPLPTILTDLTKAQSPRVEEMYRHIYWQMWQTLSEDARLLLEVMPMVSQNTGTTLTQMGAMSGLSQSQLLSAIPELVSRSLLERHGTAWEERYGIHRLTESFLRTEIIHWPGDDS